MASSGMRWPAIVDGSPFAIIWSSENPDEVTRFGGPARHLSSLQELDSLAGTAHSPNEFRDCFRAGVEVDVVCMVPFCQIREKGYKVRTNGEKICCIVVEETERIPRAALLTEIETYHQRSFELEVPPGASADCVEAPFAFDSSDLGYENVIRDVLEKEIKGGEGSSFVTPRTMTTQVKDFHSTVPLNLFRRLLQDETGSYWTFIFFDGADFFVGASPERHLTVSNGEILMNPISGTFRKRGDHVGENGCEKLRKELTEFLSDPKEMDELFMVTDEELKMMCRIAPEGGSIAGPFLKDMSHLIHTEYTLHAPSGKKNPIDVFRSSMYAPTVTGSPMANACRRLFDYETNSRGYYSSAIMLLGSETSSGGQHSTRFLDSSITIRTMEINSSGRITARVGATLVKDSVPSQEVLETKWKLRGVMTAIEKSSQRPDDMSPQRTTPPTIKQVYSTEESQKSLNSLLTARNEKVSRFWIERDFAVPSCAGRGKKKALLMNNEDDFIFMTQHILTKLGIESVCKPWDEIEAAWDADAEGWDLIVVGPGPGDPASDCDKMNTARRVIRRLLNLPRQKFLCICLGHQILCSSLGFELVRKTTPLQGVQKQCNLFGEDQLLGFYNSFHATTSSAKKLQMAADVNLCGDSEEDQLIAMSTPQYTSYQFHPESILTRDGVNILATTLDRLLGN